MVCTDALRAGVSKLDKYYEKTSDHTACIITFCETLCCLLLPDLTRFPVLGPSSLRKQFKKYWRNGDSDNVLLKVEALICPAACLNSQC